MAAVAGIVFFIALNVHQIKQRNKMTDEDRKRDDEESAFDLYQW
jgi:hypothetical protein